MDKDLLPLKEPRMQTFPALGDPPSPTVLLDEYNEVVKLHNTRVLERNHQRGLLEKERKKNAKLLKKLNHLRKQLRAFLQ